MLARLFGAIISDCSRQQPIIPFYFLARTWLGCRYREVRYGYEKGDDSVVTTTTTGWDVCVCVRCHWRANETLSFILTRVSV